MEDQADGYLLMYAVDDRRSFNAVGDCVKHLQSKFDDHSYPKPIIIAANKTDLVRRRKVKKQGEFHQISLGFRIISSVLSSIS